LRPRHIAAVALVLGLTVAGCIVARVLAARDARHESERRVAIATAQIRTRVETAATLTGSLTRFMSDEGATGITNAELTRIASRWLSPAGVPAVAWAQEIRGSDRAAYERRIGRPIVAPDERRRADPSGSSYLPTTLVSGLPPLDSRGIDLSREPGIGAALSRANLATGVGATPIAARRDGTRGLFMVAPAPNAIDGVLRPGAVVVFLSEATLRAAARNPAGLRFAPPNRSSEDRGGEHTVREEFAVAGQQFAVAMPEESVSGPGAVLPWIILAGGIVLAALAGALGVIAARRARAQRDFDRIFNLSPDLVVVAGFDGHVTRVNPAVHHVLGYTEEELLARPYVEFVHPDDRERTAAEAAAIGHGKTTLSFENRIVRKDGSVRVLEWTATPVVEDAVMYTMARDVTERRRAETEAERLAAEQAALRRVAELVAQQAPPDQVFGLVTEELNRLLGDIMVSTARFEPDATATILATRGPAKEMFPPGRNVAIAGGSTIDQVYRTGRASHVEDYKEVGGEIGPALLQLGLRWGAAGPIFVDGRLWGVMAMAAASETMPPGIQERVAQFAELVSTAISNVESRAKVERLAAEQAALRRVAELVARQAPPEEVFALVTEELSHLLDVNLVWTARFEPDGSATILAARGRAGERMPAGTNIPLLAGGVFDQVLRTGRPARLDDYARLRGLNDAALFERVREDGLRCGAGGPIVVEGRIWGAMLTASQTAESLPSGIEDRIAQFAELVSTAISNVESRAEVERLVDEQSALRRVAELVARQAPPKEVFAHVTEELSRVLDVSMVRTVRFEPDGSATVLAALSKTVSPEPPGTNFPPPSGGVLDQVLGTGRPARVEDYARIGGQTEAVMRQAGMLCAAAGPIVVEGRLWGAMAVASETPNTLPAGTEDRVAQFAELVSTAISNVESRTKVERLAAEQSALRRVATLVARAPASEQLFSTVAHEVASVLHVPGVIVTRYEADGTAVTLGEAFHSDLAGGERFLGVGSRMPQDPGSLAAQVFETQGPARIDDFSTLPGTTGDLARAAGLGSGCAGPIVVNGALWGKMCVFSGGGMVLPLGTENRLSEFIELIATAVANFESRADLAASEARARELAEEQAALRRVATLVAEGATPNHVFDAVRDEVEQMFGIPNTILMRFDPDGVATLLATPGDYLGPVGKQWPLEGDDSAVARVHRTGRAARADYTAGARGPLAEAARHGGTRFPVAVPVVVDGALWGAMSVGSRGPQQPPPDLEGRLAKFTDLLATAIANAESRADLAASEARARGLASEQAALRRVATLVAREHAPEDLFATLAEEVGVLLEVDAASILRYEADSTATVVSGWSDGTINLPLGERLPLQGDNLSAEVLRTGRPQRKEDYVGARGRIAATVRELGVRSAVASPIVVEGAIWGVIGVLSVKGEPLPPDTEARLAEFCGHAGMAVANAKSRSDLAESRARIVRAGDEARRRFERDLHDGAQQRLVSLGLELRAAEATVPPNMTDLQGVLSRVGAGLTDVLDDLRELSRGLHPAVLSEDGLSPALQSLALRSVVPVDLRIDLDGERFEEPIEVAAYYVASEALTNTAKHAHASRLEVTVRHRDGWLELTVSDDGRGGADPSTGSGLTGLVDRVEAIGGTMQIASPQGAGTAITVKLPARRSSEDRLTTTPR
jgi:PAS domain S-box-containing protein